MTIDTTPAQRPERLTLTGQYITLRPIDTAKDSADLWASAAGPGHDDLWLYLPEGPYYDRGEFEASIERKRTSEDPFYFAIADNATGKAVGHASYLRIEPKNRVTEVGSILYSPLLQRTRGATEAMYLMMRYAFEGQGNRRYEWKCNALNEPSRRAALRFGFTFEGIFRQHMIVKGENRDTAWFSILDSEWPARKAAFEAWLDPANFDAAGQQKRPLPR